MTPFKVNIDIYQGATFRKSLAWKSADDNGQNAVARDLTGYKARMQVRPSKDSSVVFHTLTTENGDIVITGATGAIDLRIGADATALFKGNRGVYDLELVAPNGDVTRLVEGIAFIHPEVTRG